MLSGALLTLAATAAARKAWTAMTRLVQRVPGLPAAALVLVDSEDGLGGLERIHGLRT